MKNGWFLGLGLESGGRDLECSTTTSVARTIRHFSSPPHIKPLPSISSFPQNPKPFAQAQPKSSLSLSLFLSTGFLHLISAMATGVLLRSLRRRDVASSSLSAYRSVCLLLTFVVIHLFVFCCRSSVLTL